MQKLLLVYYHSENCATGQIWKILPNMVFPPDLGGKNGGVLSMRMQVILDSSFARPGSAPIHASGVLDFLLDRTALWVGERIAATEKEKAKLLVMPNGTSVPDPLILRKVG